MHFTSSVLIFELSERLLARGVGIEAIERECGAALPALDDPDVRWPISSFASLVEMALRELDDPALGLHIREEVGPARRHTAFRIAACARTVREAANSFARFVALVSTADRFVPEPGDRRARTCYVPDPSAPNIPLVHEVHMVNSKRMLEMMLGGDAARARLSFGFALKEPSYADEYRRVLGTDDITFETERTFIEVDAEIIDMPLRSADPYLGALLREAAEKRLAELALEPPSTSRRVLEVLASLPPDPPATRALVAEAMGLSEKALQRRLDTDGITFRDLLDRHRRERALEWIKQGRGTAEIAYWLGFSEPTAFTRAFRRWTGSTVSKYRSTHRR